MPLPRTQIIASFEPQIEQRKGLLLCHSQAPGAVRAQNARSVSGKFSVQSGHGARYSADAEKVHQFVLEMSHNPHLS